MLDLLTEHGRLVTAAAVLDEVAENARQAGVESFEAVAVVREGRVNVIRYLAPDVPAPRQN